MHILVCVKQIPDMEAELHLDTDFGWLELPGNLEYKMNSFDEYAVEEAIRIKQEIPDAEIHAVSVGPESAVQVLQRALGMGANQGIHIRQDGHLSSYQTAELIGDNIREKNFDLVLAGAMSEDNMQGLCPALLAEKLHLPFLNGVVDLQVQAGDVYIRRELEGGCKEGFQVRLPAVLSLQSGINTPRYPALSKLLKAKQAKFETHTPGVPDKDLKLHCLQAPRQVRQGKWLQGDTRSKAEQLYNILKQKNLI